MRKLSHDDSCRDRIGELMADDDDQRQVERVRKLEKKWMLVNHRSSHSQFTKKNQPQPVPQSVSQPVPLVRVGGSSSSGTRAGSGSRATEVLTDDDREVKRVRTFKNWQRRRKNNILMPMLRCLHTRRIQCNSCSRCST